MAKWMIWVPIRNADKSQRYLLARDDEDWVETGHYEPLCKSWVDDHGVPFGNKPTHAYPIPQPPKKAARTPGKENDQ